MTQQPLLDRSAAIFHEAYQKYDPKLVVALVSGGNDSLTAYYVAAKYLHIKIDAVIHVHTGTGIPETLDFVRGWAAGLKGSQYIERSAGSAFEDYVRRKGFFGVGRQAHPFAYHLLKASPLRKAMSYLRMRRRRFPILMLTGIRLEESVNRKYYFSENTIKPDPAAPNNLFVNLIEHFSARDCLDLLNDVQAPRNPVAALLHGSRECMCGTMQTDEDRAEAEYWYPKWGRWLRELDADVRKSFGYGWGEKTTHLRKRLPCKPTDEMGMCQVCQYRLLEEEDV
jgi:3'-phosphoadenosine 5'-phosphosulfate sulfotransferase (PAPS reductase)/FAD synthetase